MAFQREVRQWSSKWKSYGILSRKCNESNDYFMTDSVRLGMLNRVPSLSFLPVDLENSELQVEGALCLLSHSLQPMDERMYVANIFTQSWKQLFPIPSVEKSWLSIKLVIDHPSVESYRVFILTHLNSTSDNYLVQIYESKSDAWITKKIIHPGGRISIDYLFDTFVFLNGILYVAARFMLHRNGLYKRDGILALNVDKGTLEDLDLRGARNSSLSLDDTRYSKWTFVQLVVHDNTLLKIMCMGSSDITLHVLKVDLELQELLEVAQSHFPYVERPSTLFFDGVHGDCTFLEPKSKAGQTPRPRYLATYHILKKEWSFNFLQPSNQNNPDDVRHVFYSRVRFRPGLNPFVEV